MPFTNSQRILKTEFKIEIMNEPPITVTTGSKFFHATESSLKIKSPLKT